MEYGKIAFKPNEVVKIDPKNLNPNTEVIRLKHYSIIPAFHGSGTTQELSAKLNFRPNYRIRNV
jgi:hypothetical protein